ncbi:MAG: DUF2085 domain-containing protein, partial [Anaerolineaceae bacterium]|nr:DUF2085 domain-containing protein [Anaerolineaceae bacterium]
VEQIVISIYNILTMIIQRIKQNKKITAFIILLFAAIFLTWIFLSHSPSGWYAKIFSIGSSVCHQIPSHSFIIGSVQFPVCARCTGLYMGSFIGIAATFLTGKKIGIPKTRIIVLLTFLFLLWVGDGLNSFISDFLNKPFLYSSSNLSRLITGYGMGLVMSTALTTLFNLTIWKTGNQIPVLKNVFQVIGYGVLSALSGLLILSGGPVIFQAAAYITIFTVVSIITLLYSIFWVIILKKENQFTDWKDMGLFILAGYSTAITQILLLNALRNKILF